MKQIIFNAAVLAVFIYNKPELYKEFKDYLFINVQGYGDLLKEDADFDRELEDAMIHENYGLELAKIGKKYKLQMPAGLLLKLAHS